MSHRNLAVPGSLAILLLAIGVIGAVIASPASAQAPQATDPPHWIYGTGQTEGHVVAVAGTDLSGRAFADDGFWVIETTASVAADVGPDSFTVNGVAVRATLERHTVWTRVTLPRTDFDPPSLAYWDLGPVDPDTTYSLAAGDGWRIFRIPRPGLETLHATCIQGSGEVWQQVGETQGWTRSAPEQLMRLALTLHRDSVHELFAEDLSSICGVEAVPLFTVATGPLVEIAAWFDFIPLDAHVLSSGPAGGRHSNGWWAKRYPMGDGGQLQVACDPGAGVVHVRTDTDQQWREVTGERLMVIASGVRDPLSQELMAEAVTDICKVDAAAHLAANHASVFAIPIPLAHFGFTEPTQTPQVWETNHKIRGGAWWAFQMPRIGMSTLYAACYEYSGVVYRWTGAGWQRSTASELLSLAVNLHYEHEIWGFESDLARWCGTSRIRIEPPQPEAPVATPPEERHTGCWQPQRYDHREDEETRAYRWGWYSFAHSCEPGVSAGLAVLDRLSAQSFVERVYRDYPGRRAPRLEWNVRLPEGWSGNFRTPERVIELPGGDTGVFNLLHEIAHDIDDLNGVSIEDHGPEFRSILLCLAQRFVWAARDVTRLTAHAQQSAIDLRVALDVATDGSEPCR